MTTVVSRSSMSVPRTQNTAPVHEYQCLYTHDIRRKQKRWQDGYVKYHTFNKRVMVYDEGRNFLGDTHWKEQGELQTDDEVTLDIGVLVQFGDLLTTSQTDLAPLFERERKKPEQEQEQSGGLSTATLVTLGGKTNTAPLRFQKHRSLSALLGTPKGSYGRSTLPAKSPYEIRNSSVEDEWEDSPNVKRQKVDQPGTIIRMSKEVPLWQRTSNARTGSMPKPRKAITKAGPKSLIVKEIVDITSDNEAPLTSDVTLPPTPARASIIRTAPLSKTTIKATAPRIPKPMITLRKERPESPPVSAGNHMRNIHTGTAAESSKVELAQSRPKTKGKPLRIAKSQPRPVLLCQKAGTAPAPELKTSRRTESNTHETAAIDLEGEIPVIIQSKPSRRRPNAYANLSDDDDDDDDDVPFSRVVPKKPQTAMTTKSIPKTTISGDAKSRTAMLASDQMGRSYSSAFSNLSPCIEHFEPPLNTAVPASRSAPSAKCTQRVETTASGCDNMEPTSGRMDQRVLITSNITFQTSNPTPLRTLPKPSTKAARSFRRVQSESNAKSNKQTTTTNLFPTVHETEPVADYTTLETASPKTALTKRPTRQPLKRATSLITSAAEKAKAKETVEIIPKEEKRETGPWTVEATDLFDWRPPDWENRVMKRAMEMNN